MRLRLLLPLLFLIFGVFLVDAKAVSYGYSYIETYHPEPAASTRIYAETGTVLDYNTWYYYDPGIQGFLYENSSQIAYTDRLMNNSDPTIYIYTSPDPDARYGSTYLLHGDHFLGAYYYYVSGGHPVYIDQYGFNHFQGNFPTPYSFSQGTTGYYNYRIYKAATTRVSIPATGPLHLSSIDRNGGAPGTTFLTTLRGTGLFGTGNGQGANQTVQVSGGGVTATVQQTQPNTIEVIDVNFEIASNATVGDRNLTLTVNGQVSNSITFRVGDNSPQITAMSPPQGNAGDQVAVTITGSHFGFNPDVEIDGLGVARAITFSTTTEITAIFSVAETADPGTRGVKVRSRGITGTGFESVPGNSERSNSVPFDVAAANPRVEISDIGSVGKGSVKDITVTTLNAPAGHVTRLRFKNQPPPPATRPPDGWKTGEARFVNPADQDVTDIMYSGDQPQTIRIRGWERSNSRDNVKLEARFNNDSDVKKDKSFSVSSVEFVEEDVCTGYDNIEFERTRNYTTRYLFVPKGGSNGIKARITPSGATGDFILSPASPTNLTVSPTSIISTNARLIAVAAGANESVGNGNGILAKANNTSPLTRDAEFLTTHVLERKDKTVVLHRVTEENDDVQRIPQGQGQPNTAAYVFSFGPNGFLDSVAQGDDWLATVPIVQRPPGYSPRSRRVFTGDNGLLETMPQGDDEIFSSANKQEMIEYAPINQILTGMADVVCITSGTNLFLDTLVRSGSDDQIRPDSTNPALQVITAGANGRCDTGANRSNIRPPEPPNAAALQTYLNSITWGRQANIYFTVDTVVRNETVNFDLNRDGKFKHPNIGQDEAVAIDANKVAGALNLYYFGVDITPRDSTATSPAAFATYPLDRAFFTNRALENLPAAHEIGHLLGRSGHSPADADYISTLMYFQYSLGETKCKLTEYDWTLIQ